MTFRMLLISGMCGVCLVWQARAAEGEVPEDAARYLRVLENRPHQAALFDRFQNAWLDERSSDELQAFFAARAEAEGGANWALLARYHLRRGQDDEALAALTSAIEALPDDLVLRVERARVNARRLDFDAAVEDLEEARRADDPEQALQAAKLLGQTRMRAGDIEAAIEVWDETLEAHPGDEALLEDLVELAAAEGETEQALAFMERLLEATRDPYRKALREMRRGDLLGTAGRFDDALEVYDATLSAVGQGSWLEREVLAQVDALFRRGGREAELKEHLEALAEAHPGRLLVHRQLAKLEAGAGELDEAIGRFREVLRRSPGDRELREEFIRLLADGERVDDAAAELEKLIEEAPEDAALWLRMAALRHRAAAPEKTLEALQQARERMGGSEPEALRIAGLMLGYELEEPGVALLRERMQAAGASAAPAEMLAVHFARTDRRDQALELLAELAGHEDLDTLLRATSSALTLGESGKSFEWLAARRGDFGSDWRFLVTMVRAALAADEPGEATADAMRLVRIATTADELAEAVGLSAQVIEAADETGERLEALAGLDAPSMGERCLHAALLERQGDFHAVDGLLGDAETPELVWFHTAVLERRGEPVRAVERLLSLADTEEGRRAAYLKELAELQMRANDREAALATAEKWKQSAPGDRAAWIFGAELQRQSGRYDEAMRELRRAVVRFDGDAELAARLAQWHAERGDFAEADAIHWRLYDEAETPADQLRWGARLAEGAVASGRVAQLDERFAERARADRRAVGPLLARAELARLTERGDLRRDLLMEAVRLQPADIDLRMRIARIEEESGEIERAQAILEEALATNRDDRVRRELAQLYLRGGEVEKGLRQLRELIGGEAADPRELDRLAMSMAGSGYYEQATAMLRDGMVDGGDWRSRYLLASMLAEDGHELEAVPMFFDLLDADGEIDGLTAARSGMMTYFSNQPPEVARLMMMSHSAQMVNNARQGHYGGAPGALFPLPESAEFARLMALARLFQIESRLGESDGEGIARRLEGSGVEDLALMRDLADLSGGGNPWARVIEKHPDYIGVQMVALMHLGQLRQTGEDVLDRGMLLSAVENERVPTPMRYQGAVFLLADDPGDEAQLERFLEIADEVLADEPLEPGVAMGVAPTLTNLLGSDAVDDASREGLRARLLALLERRDADGALEVAGSSRMNAEMALDPEADLIALLNAAVAQHQENPPTGLAAMLSGLSGSQISQMMAAGVTVAQLRQMMGSFGGGMQGTMNFDLETLELASLPMWIAEVVVPEGRPANPGGRHRFFMRNNDPIGGEPELIQAGDLLDRLDALESPVLRAWVALRAGDADAIGRTQSADSDNPAELRDLAMLRLVPRAGETPEPEARYAQFATLRALTAGDRELSQQLDLQMLELAPQMGAEARESHERELRALLIRCRAAMGAEFDALAFAKATELGFEDLAERFNRAARPGGGPSSALAGAAIGRQPHSRGGTGPADPLEKIREFTAGGRPEAAAREAWKVIRDRTNQRSHYGRNPLAELTEALDEAGIEALKALAHPGESRSRNRRLDYVDLCEVLGLEDERLAILDPMLAERPNDAEIAVRLAFSPGLEESRVIELMQVASAADQELARRANETLEARVNRGNADAVILAFERVAAWLEAAAPSHLAGLNLTWVNYHARQFMGRMHSLNLRSMFDEPEENPDDQAKRRAEVGWRLMKAMLRHDGTAEAGFRLMHASWQPDGPAEELDAHARRAITAKPEVMQFGGSRRVFILRTGMSTRSSGDDMDQHASWVWLAQRMNETEVSTVMPDAFFDDLDAQSPELATALRAFATVRDRASLEAFRDTVDSGKLDASIISGLRRALAERAVMIDGAVEFFIEELAELPDGGLMGNPNVYRDPRSDENIARIVQAIVVAAKAGSIAQIDRAAAEVKRALIGPNQDWETILNNHGHSHSLYVIESTLDSSLTEPAARVKASRLRFITGAPFTFTSHQLRQTFRDAKFDDPEALERFLDETGLLCDAADWHPPGVVESEETGRVGNRRQVSLKRQSIFEEAMHAVRPNGTTAREEFQKRLEAREAGRFGTLMVLAAMADGDARGEFTARAFEAAAEDLLALSPEQWDMIGFAAEWLPNDALANLPPELAARLDSEAETRREALREEIARVRTSLRGGAVVDRSFSLVENLIPRIVEDSPEEAAGLFVDAEAAYTRSLGRGGRFSSWTTSGFEYSMRDAALATILGDEQIQTDGQTALKFLVAVMNSPAAERLGYATHRSDGLAALATQSIGKKIVAENTESKDKPLAQMIDWLRYCDTAGDAYAGIVFIGILEHYRWNSSRVEPLSKKLRESDVADSIWLEPALGVVGVKSWSNLSEQERALTQERIAAMLRRDDIPLALKPGLVRKLYSTSFDSTISPGIAEAVAEFYERYAAEDRSVVHQDSMVILRWATVAASAPGSLPAIRRVAAAFWGNANAPKPAGHSPMPLEMAKAAVIVSLLSGCENAAGVVQPIRGEMSNRFPVILAAIVAGDFELAASLMPPGGASFPRWTTHIKRTPLVEQRMREFSGFHGDPEASLLVESASFFLTRMPGSDPEVENALARDMVDRFVALDPADTASYRHILWHLARRLPDEPRLRPALHAHLEAGGYRELFVRKLAGDASPENQAGPKRLGEIGAELHELAALWALADGDAEPLAGVVAVMSDAGSHPENYWRGDMRRDFRRFYDFAAAVLICQIAQNETDGFEQGAEVFARLAVHADGHDYLQRSDFAWPARVAHLMWTWAGTPERFDAWVDELPEKLREETRKMVGERQFELLPGRVSDEYFWTHEISGDLRNRYTRAMLTHPQLVDYYSPTADWSTLPEAVVPEGEVLAIAENPPDDLLREVAPALAAFAGREAARARRNGRAVGFFERALESAEGEEFDEFRGRIKVDMARALDRSDRKAEAVELLESGFTKAERAGSTERNRTRLLNQLKK